MGISVHTAGTEMATTPTTMTYESHTFNLTAVQCTLECGMHISYVLSIRRLATVLQFSASAPCVGAFGLLYGLSLTIARDFPTHVLE